MVCHTVLDQFYVDKVVQDQTALGKILGLKTQDAVEIKESKYNETGSLIPLWYSQNISPSSISGSVRYWEEIMSWVKLVQVLVDTDRMWIEVM